MAPFFNANEMRALLVNVLPEILFIKFVSINTLSESNIFVCTVCIHTQVATDFSFSKRLGISWLECPSFLEELKFTLRLHYKAPKSLQSLIL